MLDLYMLWSIWIIINIFFKFQSGFRTGHNTVSALLKIVHDFHRAFDSGRIGILLLLDFSKAFDSVSHMILLEINFNFSGSWVKLLSSYLSNRIQKIGMNRVLSSANGVVSGIPQGSILEPLLFLIFINDLPDCLSITNYHLFADDVQLYTSSDTNSLSGAIDSFNLEIDRVLRWASYNPLSINASKSQAMIILRCSLDTSDLPDIIVNGDPVKYVTKVKNLGLILNTKVESWVHYGLRTLWSFASITTAATRIIYADSV